MSLKGEGLWIAILLWLLSYLPCSLQIYIAIMIFLYAYIHFRNFIWIVLILSIFLIVTIVRVDRINDPITYTGEIIMIEKNYTVVKIDNQKILVYNLKKDILPHDTIKFEGNYERIQSLYNFHLFHFATYMKSQQIYFSIYAKQYQIVERSTHPSSLIYQKINKIENEKMKKISYVMLFGIQDDFVVSVITSSGMHISIITAWVYRICRKRISRQSALILRIVMGIVLGAFTMYSFTIYRILIFSFFKLFKKWNQKDQLACSLIICLLFFQNIQYHIAFLLPVLFSLLSIFSKNIHYKKLYSYPFIIFIQLMFFHLCDISQILLFKYLRNLYGIIYLSIWFYLLYPIAFIEKIVFVISDCLNAIHQISLPLYYHPPLLWTILWLLSCLVMIQKKKISILFFAILLCYTQIHANINPMFEVMMIDIGQGDCFLIQLPYQHGNILIDAGGHKNRNNALDIIIPELKQQGIKSLDYVILTHDDFDHTGAVSSLKEHIKVDKVVDTRNEEIRIGDFYLQVLPIDIEHADNNDQSIVIYFEYEEVKFLFMGDASIKIEQQIMKEYPNLKADVLKVGHHGSKTSSSLAFLHQLDIKIALISSGYHNFYGHPHQEVLHNLDRERILYFNTAEVGAVSIQISKFFKFYRTARGDFGIMR